MVVLGQGTPRGFPTFSPLLESKLSVLSSAAVLTLGTLVPPLDYLSPPPCCPSCCQPSFHVEARALLLNRISIKSIPVVETPP